MRASGHQECNHIIEVVRAHSGEGRCNGRVGVRARGSDIFVVSGRHSEGVLADVFR